MDQAAGGPGRGGEAIQTLDLLKRVRAGDRQALESLCERYLPRLRRWVSGHLPRWARDLADTDDLIQETLLHTIRQLDDFEPRNEAAFQAYLRQAVLNRIRGEIRRAGRRKAPVEFPDYEPSKDASPLEQAIGKQAVERYEAALQRLRSEEREAIVARVEMNLGYEELAAALGKPSPDAARMAVSRWPLA